ncbi:hypothetical protein BJX68DRAFT_261791 [Aspergillus pseudodeflectus]|uniref:Uncharacterized protein n=1 Tax=Aspergillus pseudodeflectus TaxID=176178 RepID=A0ABR4L467_9EURO
MHVACRIRKYVVNGDAQEAKKVKDAYKDTLAMEAVAVSIACSKPLILEWKLVGPLVTCIQAAIIAQIAITMISLPNFDSVHWAATAVAYSSLICGILTTFLAFIVQQILSDLHNPEEVRSWLTTTQRSHSLRQIFDTRSRSINATEKKIPSLRSAVLLTTPGKLLRLSILTAFAALGIYLRCVWDAELGNLRGRDANFWVFLVFSVFLFVMLQDAFLPFLVASYPSSRSTDEELQDLGDGVPRPRLGVSSTIGVAAGADEIIRDALESSIRAQEESLKAQKALLDLIDRRSSGTTTVTTLPRVLLR